ncbi:hypothetical protein RB653_009067 [Dictyostelium firmibasis]|uniref:Uncharacterized protein n=1 Tax=Dictyostelium firmibasis TaxID=79012 RepID=A0AAN7U1C0_9MYCE
MQAKIIVSIICFVVFLALAGSTLYLSLAVLKPSIELGEGIVSTSCLVTSTDEQTLCNNQKCVDQNNEIWWYNSWGPSYFFVYVSGPTGGSDYYNDDGGGDDDDDDGGDGDDDDGEDSGDGDSGGDSGDDSGGDSGGGDSGGDIGGGDEMMMRKSKLLNKKEGLFGASSSFGTTGASEHVGYVPQEIKEKRMERKLQQKKLSRSLKAATTGTAPTSGSSYYGSSASSCNTCYQGIFYVNYPIGNGTVIESSIKGLVSSDYSWVSNYVDNYNDTYYTCYYQQSNPENVVWFRPPKYNTGSLVGTIILSVLSFIFLLVSGILLVLGLGHSNHHHHHNNHSTKKTHASGAYKPISNPTPISAKKGNYQSYHKNNGSYHGGYSASDVAPPPQYTPAVPAYYQYNQGVAQIDFSGNNNNYGSINYVNAPPKYGN